MKHIKNYLNENNTYGVEITFVIDKDNQYVKGFSSHGTETKDEIKMIYDNLKRMGYIKEYNQPLGIGFVDGGVDDNGTPIIDLYFNPDGEDIDEDNTPVCSVTEEFLKELGF